VNVFACDSARLMVFAVNAYTIVLLVYAVMSWVPDLRGGRWAYYLASIVEPLLTPIRRIIPPLGGLDLAFLVLLLVLQLLVRPAIEQFAINSCIAIY
jgi:YggT family protein